MLLEERITWFSCLCSLRIWRAIPSVDCKIQGKKRIYIIIFFFHSQFCFCGANCIQGVLDAQHVLYQSLRKFSKHENKNSFWNQAGAPACPSALALSPQLLGIHQPCVQSKQGGHLERCAASDRTYSTDSLSVWLGAPVLPPCPAPSYREPQPSSEQSWIRMALPARGPYIAFSSAQSSAAKDTTKNKKSSTAAKNVFLFLKWPALKILRATKVQNTFMSLTLSRAKWLIFF